MHNSAAAGRRLAQVLVFRQLAVTGMLSAVAAYFGVDAALGAGVGGGAVAFGTALMAWRTFRGDASSPGVALMQLVGGVALRWILILAVLYGALAIAQLPPLAVLLGLCAALLSGLWSIRTSS